MQEIETARLYLRQFTPNDLDELYRIYNDRAIMKYIGKGVRTRAETESAIICSNIGNKITSECGL
jgi:RimJ/RimL family protein N-acetyltransferase